MRGNRAFIVVGAVLAGVGVNAGVPAGAEEVQYMIDPARTFLIAGGSLSGGTQAAQTPESNRSSFSGFVRAERTGATITFLDLSNIDAALQATGQRPRPGGEDDRSAPADFGLVATNTFGTQTFAAYRDVLLGLNSDPLPVTGGTFAGDLVMAAIFNAQVDWNANFTWDSEIFGPRLRANLHPDAATMSTLVTADGVETLTLPISFSQTYSTITPNDSTFSFTGQIVATRNAGPPPPQWSNDGGGSWGNPANWTDGVPDPATGASFLGALTPPNAPAVITLDGDRNVHKLVFDNLNTYEIASGTGGTLTVGEANASGSINVASGHHRISAPLRITRDVAVQVGLNASLELTAPFVVSIAQNLTKSGPGLLRTAAVTNADGQITLAEGPIEFTGAVNNNGDGEIILNAGAATFTGPVNNTADATLSVRQAATATFAGPVTNTGNIDGEGTKTFQAPTNSLGRIGGGDGVTVITETASATATQVRERSLTVRGELKINPNSTAAGVSRVDLLDVDVFSGGFLDLTNNSMIVTQTGTDQIAFFAWNAKTQGQTPWQGPGLGSTSATPITGVAVVRNDAGEFQPLMETFAGVPVAYGETLIKFTYNGDADLDGRITARDFFLIDRGRAMGLPGYANGDFDYSGGVANSEDYMLIDRAFIGQGPRLSGGGPAALHGGVVPEPGAGILVACAALGLSRRRGRGGA